MILLCCYCHFHSNIHFYCHIHCHIHSDIHCHTVTVIFPVTVIFTLIFTVTVIFPVTVIFTLIFTVTVIFTVTFTLTLIFIVKVLFTATFTHSHCPCHFHCLALDKPVGVSDKYLVKDQHMTSSYDIVSRNFDASNGRLNYTEYGGGWCSYYQDDKQWLQIDLVQPQKISAFKLQGAENSADRVLTYKVATSSDGNSWVSHSTVRISPYLF